MGMTGGRMASFVCADCALMASVSTREIIKLWDADFSDDCPKATGNVKSLFPSQGP